MEITARVFEEFPEESKSIPTFESPQLEIKHLNSLASKEELLAVNESFINSCENHDKDALKEVLKSRKCPILIYYAVKSVNMLLENKDYALLTYLIESGLDLSHLAFKGTIPRLVIMLAGNEEEFEKMIKILTDGGLLIDDIEPESCSTGLHIACLRLDISIVRILLKFNANPNPINRYKLMPMNLVEKEDCDEAREIKNILIEAGGQSVWNNYMN